MRIRIYSVNGRVVDEVKASGLLGYNPDPSAPSLRLAGGSYLYRITATATRELPKRKGSCDDFVSIDKFARCARLIQAIPFTP